MARLQVLAVVLSVTSAAAQTYVVDANNGPGTHFPSIAAAIAAVPDGAVLDVRPGTYSAFVIDHKGLTILGTGAIVQGPLGSPAMQVMNTTASQVVVLCGLTAGPANALLAANQCTGPLLFESLTGQTSLALVWVDVSLSRCRQVMLRNVTGSNGSMTVVGADVAMENCAFHGHPVGGLGNPGPYPEAALTLTNATATLTNCVLRGGDGGPSSPGVAPDAPAISMTSSSLRVQGNSSLSSGQSGSGGAPAVGGSPASGTARIDPRVQMVFSGTVEIDPAITASAMPLPDLVGQSAPPGGSLGASLRGPALQPAVLVVGWPGPPLLASNIDDALWVDPAAYTFAAWGTPLPGSPLVAAVAVPNRPDLRGITLAWQGVTLAASGGLVASNPSWTVVY